MNETKILSLADRYKELRDKKSQLDFEKRELDAELEVVELELIQEMTSAEMDGFKHRGVTFSLVTKEYPSAVPERKAELYDEMKVKGFEHLFTINSNTLNATLKELKANNENVMPDWLDGLVKVSEKVSIQLRNK